MSDNESDDKKESATIDSLPIEIISIILKHNDCRDTVRFSQTCKFFYEMVRNDQCLWKELCKDV